MVKGFDERMRYQRLERISPRYSNTPRVAVCQKRGAIPASGYGRSSLARFAYKPETGDLKSGMPADVEMPAPVCKTGH